MRKGFFLVLCLILAVIFSGCVADEGARKGAVTGGLLGAVAGGIIGHQSGRGLEGAAIGGTAGAIGGGIFGSEKKSMQSNPSHLTISSIAQMAFDGVPDNVIISDIRQTNSVYNLTSEAISFLKSKGASDRIIDYMLSTSK